MSGDRDAFYHGTFPPGFAWSTATAAYQIEGGWDADGKGPSIWDTYCHGPELRVMHGHTGDVACDSYHRYDRDVRLIRQLGTSHYRLSLSWPRLLPDGTLGSLNPAGVAYYDRVLDALVAAGVQPMVTLFHWDLPQALQDIGGWTNPRLAQLFAEYARLCFRSFGDRVKLWLTFNEPSIFVWWGYGKGILAPGTKDPLGEPWTIGHTVIRAHALSYHIYCDEFKPHQRGQCGITLNMDWYEPKDPSSPADRAAADRAMAVKLGWWADPVFGSGDYPQLLKDQLQLKAKQRGLAESPLKLFTEEEIRSNKGTWDFFGLNHYTTWLVSDSKGLTNFTNDLAIMDVQDDTDPSWARAESFWLYVVPWGIRRLLNYIKDHYANPPIYITENGFSDSDSDDLQDDDRIDYFRRYINEVLKAVRLDGADVRGYTAWSLLDNFEWSAGYTHRFGLHHVDFTHPDRPATPKASARFYAQIVKDNGFPKKHPSL